MPLTARRRVAVRFSLGALLFITLCVCGYFAGYRRGFTAGDHARPLSGAYAISYSVADLLMTASEPDTPPARRAMGDQLIDMIVDIIETDTWLENGGLDGEIQWDESNESLMIRQRAPVHERICTLLKQLRAHPGLVEAYRRPDLGRNPSP